MLINKPTRSRASAGQSVPAELECRTRNDRQSYIAMARAIANAQFVLADQELSRRLWQDVADRELDMSRILHLLYGGWDLSSDEEVGEADRAFLSLEKV